jgi:hypothetical protein
VEVVGDVAAVAFVCVDAVAVWPWVCWAAFLVSVVAALLSVLAVVPSARLEAV